MYELVIQAHPSMSANHLGEQEPDTFCFFWYFLYAKAEIKTLTIKIIFVKDKFSIAKNKSMYNHFFWFL